MASVTAWIILYNGEQAGARVKVENDYPDALSQAARTVVDVIREAMQARRDMAED